jgi:hypothetical protein
MFVCGENNGNNGVIMSWHENGWRNGENIWQHHE